VSNRSLDFSGNGAREPLPSGAGVLEGWRRLEFERTPIFVQPTGPDWFVPNARADTILRELQAGASPLEAAVRCRDQWGGSEAASWEDVQRTLARVPARPARPPALRADVLRLEALRECWLHISNRCNLACTHCMFGSSPHDDRELPTSRLLAIAAEARALGCRLFYLTGGEPLVHPGFSTLCRALLEDPDAHVIVLTNALMLPRVEADLVTMPRDRVHFQVSVDCPHGHHDAIRGEGSYDRVLARTHRLVELGFPATLAMAVDGRNAHHMPELVEVAASLGVASVHYLWHFVRGGGSTVPRAPVNALLAGLRAAYALGRNSGVAIDNVAIFAAQVFALPGTRHDLSNAGWESLAVGPDDRVYPTAAMVLDERVACGPPGAPLADVWKTSPVLTELRHASVANAPAKGDTLAYIAGGGDVDHSYFAGGRFTGRDPYRELADRIALWLIAEEAGADPRPERALLLARMGERVESCAESVDGIAFTHSNCVLSLPGKDGHTLVRDFYAAAAAAPQVEIANPVRFDAGETAHVPEEAKTRSYGCGSPVLDAAPLPGETVVDLGSGAGMECAIAAKKVGPGGHVVGVDMLDEMLALARRTAAHAAGELGHDVIEVRKGLLEEVPCPDASADVVISNCVINLSPNKRRTFREILRVLKPGGRLVVADVVADEEPPLAVRSNERLRGECLGGAMLQRELFQLLEDCGFTAVTLLKRFPYRTVAGHRFYSATYQAERPQATEPSRVVYRGPFAALVTDDGRVLRRGEEAVAAVPAGAAAEPVFVLDAEGAVANVELGTGCSCFVPPEAVQAVPRAVKLTDREGCMVCGAPVEYLPVAVAQRCHFCGRELSTSARCVAGHFVCDICHTEDAAAAIRAICAVSREPDMVALMRRVREHPAISIHGPEHHVLVPAVVVTAARNAGLPVDETHLDTAIARGKTIAGGACAFMGACGAALGVGTGFSVILGINPYQGENRQIVQQLVGRALARIAALPAARCCQRDCWLALQEAAASSEELLGVRLPAEEPLACTQAAHNKECLHAGCPLWPRRVDPPAQL